MRAGRRRHRRHVHRPDPRRRRDRRVRGRKSLTTPDDPSQAVETVLVEALDAPGVDAGRRSARSIHGTTLVTNAIIERKGARTALLTTARLPRRARDRPRAPLRPLRPRPRAAASRWCRATCASTCRERTLADGTTLAGRSTTRYVERLARELADAGRRGGRGRVPAQLTPTRRTSARRARPMRARRAGHARLDLVARSCPRSASSSAPRRRSPTSTCRAASSSYLRELRAAARARSGSRGVCSLMLSSGGIATLETATRFPVRLLESGPAAGALAAAHLRRRGRRRRPALVRHGRHDRQVLRDRRRRAADRAASSRSTGVYRFKKGSGLPVKIAGHRDDRDRRGRRLDRARRLAGPAQGRAGLGGRRPGPGLLRPRRHASRPSPTPTSCSATSTRASSSAAGMQLDLDGARARDRASASPSRSA